MKQIRENIFQITFSELSNPSKRGDFKLKGFGTVMIDVADLHYADEMRSIGYEPTLFVSRSEVLGGRYVVVSRQQKA